MNFQISNTIRNKFHAIFINPYRKDYGFLDRWFNLLFPPIEEKTVEEYLSKNIDNLRLAIYLLIEKEYELLDSAVYLEIIKGIAPDFDTPRSAFRKSIDVLQTKKYFLPWGSINNKTRKEKFTRLMTEATFIRHYLSQVDSARNNLNIFIEEFEDGIYDDDVVLWGGHPNLNIAWVTIYEELEKLKSIKTSEMLNSILSFLGIPVYFPTSSIGDNLGWIQIIYPDDLDLELYQPNSTNIFWGENIDNENEYFMPSEKSMITGGRTFNYNNPTNPAKEWIHEPFEAQLKGFDFELLGTPNASTNRMGLLKELYKRYQNK